MLQAYFDESGTHWGRGGSKFLAICGYIAPESEWKKFEITWKSILSKYRVRCFHAKVIESRIKRATGDVRRKYESLKIDLVNAVVNSGIIGISSGMVLESYEKFAPQLKGLIDNPYMLCFQHAIVEAVKRGNSFLGENPKEKIAFIFDQHNMFSITAHELFKESLEDKDLKARYRLGSLTFADKTTYIPLQAADHIAYETYRWMSEPGKQKRPAMRRFGQWGQHNGRYFDDSGFKSFIEQCRKDGKL
jgi:hypothetical protein